MLPQEYLLNNSVISMGIYSGKQRLSCFRPASHSGSLSLGRARAPRGSVWSFCPWPWKLKILLRVLVSGFLCWFQESEKDTAQASIRYGKEQMILLFLGYSLWPWISSGTHHCSSLKNSRKSKRGSWTNILCFSACTRGKCVGERRDSRYLRNKSLLCTPVSTLELSTSWQMLQASTGTAPRLTSALIMPWLKPFRVKYKVLKMVSKTLLSPFYLS